MFQLAASMLSAEFGNLNMDLKEMSDAGVKILHLDVMDGEFVPNISYVEPVISSIRRTCSLYFDVHLMVNDPIRYVVQMRSAGADIITVHVEACKDVSETIRAVRNSGATVGLSIKPPTPVSEVLPYLDDVDIILIMTVNPGFGGQKMIPECIDKIKELRRVIDERNSNTLIEADGGIKPDNVNEICKAGADIIVSGSGVFRGDIKENINNFFNTFKEYEK